MLHLQNHFFECNTKAELIQIRLKGYYNNVINVRISSDGYRSNVRKLSRCRPTLLSKTVPESKQEFL